jgi:hypothetical protein
MYPICDFNLFRFLLHSLESCAETSYSCVQRSVLMSYNNKPVEEAVPGGVPSGVSAPFSALHGFVLSDEPYAGATSSSAEYVSNPRAHPFTKGFSRDLSFKKLYAEKDLCEGSEPVPPMQENCTSRTLNQVSNHTGQVSPLASQLLEYQSLLTPQIQEFMPMITDTPLGKQLLPYVNQLNQSVGEVRFVHETLVVIYPFRHTMWPSMIRGEHSLVNKHKRVCMIS